MSQNNDFENQAGPDAPPDPRAAKLQAEIAQHMGSQNFKAAIEAFQKMLVLEPGNGNLLTGLATAYALNSQMVDAVRTQEKTLELYPADFGYKLNLLKILLMGRDYEYADQLIKQMTPICPADRLGDFEELKKIHTLAVERQAEKEVEKVDLAQPSTPAGLVQSIDDAIKAEPVASQAAGSLDRVPPKPPAVQMTSRPLKVLFAQTAPCIRNYKTARALIARGHQVSLAYTLMPLSQMYQGLSDEIYHECIKINGRRDLWDLTAHYDLVHCHNEPDWLTVSALAGDAPVVHDTHDLISLREREDKNVAFFEGLANRSAQGRVYTTPYQEQAAREIYGVKGPSLVFYNYTSASDLPQRLLPKLSANDGQIHIVYEGSIGGTLHRDFINVFVGLAQRGIQVHIYPARFKPEFVEQFSPYPRIHYNQPVSPQTIMQEMSQFDVGIIPFNLEKGDKGFLDSTIANKLFEYLAAGLPVLTSPLQSYVDYFADHQVGSVFHGLDDLLQKLPGLIDLARSHDLTAYAKTYEGEVEKLESLYYQVIDAS